MEYIALFCQSFYLCWHLGLYGLHWLLATLPAIV